MVLLTHAYFLAEDPKEQQIMRPYVPLGILYIAAYLDKQGVENEVFDSTFSDFNTLCQKLLDCRPRILAVYVNLMTKVNVLKIIHFVKNQPLLAHTQILLGGPEVKNHADNFLQYGADFLVIGEGEQTTLECVQAILAGKELAAFKEIEGLAFKLENQKSFFSSERQKLKQLDELPFPARHKVNLQLYLDAWKQAHGQNAISVSSMRGCPYTCRWCSRAVYGLSYRRMSPERVVRELVEIYAHYQPDTLWFVDDVFTISHKWLAGFVEELKKSGLKIAYECITRADRMNEEVITLLKESGCFRVWIGAESGSQAVIDKMDRRVSVMQVREMIRQTRQNGIQAGTFIMLGYPDETEADIEETIVHLKAGNPDHFTITVAYPIKGTELYEDVAPNMMQMPDWASSTDRDIDFRRTYPRRYYDFAVRRVVNEVNFHKAKLGKGSLSLPAVKFKLRSIAAKLMMWGVRTWGV